VGARKDWNWQAAGILAWKVVGATDLMNADAGGSLLYTGFLSLYV
jgi:hypothetical protein